MAPTVTAERLQCWAVGGVGEVLPGIDLAAHLAAPIRAAGGLRPWDVVVVTHKIVSKAEGRLVELGTVEPGPDALRLADQVGSDPRLVEVILRETRRVVRAVPGLLVAETHQGLVCANAGVDRSNVGGGGLASLLPEDPDASADRLQRAWLPLAGGGPLGVVVTDTFGRPFRDGGVNVAIGVAGMPAMSDHRGVEDPYGYQLRVSTLATADEIAGLGELVMGKVEERPLAVVRGLRWEKGAGDGDGGGAAAGARALQRDPARDVFRW
ncbi:MAG TPA: coenzyme F420-0:L-glutamate ligase [Candidatus Micrarchaeia archaeon]|nr:coenzyme F420-0:L-glutamate ligase [Candidatus Micrarchaeia archaeon]